MKLRRYIALGLALVCLAGFASCGKKNKGTTEQTTEATTTAAATLGLSDSISSVLEQGNLGGLLAEQGLELYKNSSELGIVALSVENVMKMGFEASGDMNAMLRPGEVSPAIELEKGETKLEVSVVNPYDVDVAVGSGIIAGCTVKSFSGDAFGGFTFGKATPEQIASVLGTPYELSEDSMVYKVFGGKAWDMGKLGELYTGFTGDSLYNWELVFGLAGGVLTSVSLFDPMLFHGGVGENLEPEELETVTYEEKTEIVRIKNSILSELTKGFAAEDIEVTVDSATGEIVLSDAVLFGNESYTLSQEGKAYLDRVFSVYAEVLLAGEYSGNVSAIVFEGHTNTLGTFEYNQDLSEKRAAAVFDHCLESENTGMDDAQRTQLSSLARTEGRAYTDPVYTPGGEVDMEASRRVCIKFHVTVE